MRRLPFFVFASLSVLGLAAAAAGACNTYDESLLEGGGGSSSKGGGGQGEGGEAACTEPGDCPGMDGECGTRTCEAETCGVEAQPAGTPTSTQSPGDCSTMVCDGNGATDTQPDDADVEDDNNSCTTDSCVDGAPRHDPLPGGSPCTMGGTVCNMAGQCVECVDGSHCASGVCTEQFVCAPSSCADMMQNGQETDIDCGGTMCPGCQEGETCQTGADCVSGICSGMECQPSCIDMVENQGETDVDCGGGVCPPCAVGQGCSIGADCVSGSCGGTTCSEYQLLIGEFRGRGPTGGGDDFVELYNPLNVPVTLSNDIEVASRSDQAMNYSVKWTAAGETIPARGHILLAGPSYSGSVAPDDTLTSGLTDKVSVVVRRAGTTLDAACLYCGANPFDASYTCEGTPIAVAGCTGTTWGDKSLERKPGGAAGNGTDTGDTTADFNVLMISNPQNLSSPPTP